MPVGRSVSQAGRSENPLVWQGSYQRGGWSVRAGQGAAVVGE